MDYVGQSVMNLYPGDLQQGAGRLLDFRQMGTTGHHQTKEARESQDALDEPAHCGLGTVNR